MKGKRILSRKKREAVLFLERMLLIVITICMVLLFINSYFYIEMPYGTVYHYEISPFEKDKSFEKNEIFTSLLLGNIEQITRYVVIRNQLEDAGEYKEDKIINITEFANRSNGVSGKEITARYYLDDLITWGNYGFNYNTVAGTWEELSSLFDNNDVLYTKNKGYLKEYEGSMEENAGLLAVEGGSGDQYAMEILVPRYKTVEGKDLLDCASDIEEYETLKENLIISAESLFRNYTEYIRAKDIYKPDNTNISYYIQIPSEKEILTYTNSTLIKQGMSSDDITSGIREEGGAFIYFNPDKVQITTNTNISALQMRNILKEYEYTFSENTKVWFWVDKEYEVHDTFRIVKDEVESFLPFSGSLLTIIMISSILLLSLLYFVTVKEGRVERTDGDLGWKIEKGDNLFFEICFLGTIFISVISFRSLNILWQMFRAGNISASILPVSIGSLVFCLHEISLRFYLSCVRRWKAKKIWKTTFLYYIGNVGKSFLVKVYHNGSVVSRTWIPYLIFLIINLILVLLGIGGVIGAFLLDMLVGIYLYHEKRQIEEIVQAIEKIKNEDDSHRIDLTKYTGDNYRLASSVNSIGAAIREAVETSMKDEKLKTDLITNVSHDIKTPITSIITYVDLLKREKLTDSRLCGYIDILDNKSQRLKQLVDDLVEVSKISSGNIELQLEKIDFVELVRQALGEFEDKLVKNNLNIVFKSPESPMYVMADSSHLWRVMENLMINACKYSMEGTRIYVEMESIRKKQEEYHSFLIKNISAGYLDVSPEDLMERFIRGDKSRKTEGSGLGLSISKNLVEALGGEFKIEIDGDLFKATVLLKSI